MTVTVRALVSDIADALATALPGWNVSTGTPYGVTLTGDDASFLTGGKVKAALLLEVTPDGVQRVGGIQDLRATVRLEMYREAEAALDAGSMPAFRDDVTRAVSAILGLANCEAARTVSVAPRSVFMDRICHRAEVYARFIRLCPVEE